VQGYVNDDLTADGLQKGWGFQVGTWNVDSLTGRTGEVVDALSDRKVDVACIQETRWKGNGCKFDEDKGKRYKVFWMVDEERSDGVGRNPTETGKYLANKYEIRISSNMSIIPS